MGSIRSTAGDPYRADGVTLGSDHHGDQEAFVLAQFRVRDDAADFAVGLNDAIVKIEASLGLERQAAQGSRTLFQAITSSSFWRGGICLRVAC